MSEARNPRTGQIDYSFQPVTSDELAATCARLRGSQREWYRRGVQDRADVLRKFAAQVHLMREEICKALTDDTGRLALSYMEIDALEGYTLARCDEAARALTPVSGSSSSGTVTFEQELVPYSLLAVIAPWNYPLILSFLDCVPALLAGCAAIVKPSEVTPRFVEPVRRAIAAVPELAKVLDVVTGGPETGQSMIKLADAVVFTGSVATGRKIAVAAASELKPAFLELGGKDPAIVLRTATIESAAHAIMRGSAVNTGQSCFSIERVYVDRSIADALTEKLVQLAGKIEINYPNIASGHMGPLIFAKQAETIQAHLDDAVAKGARILINGVIERHGGGLWIRPTILANVDHTMRIMREETFGPILPIMTFQTEEEAIRLANDTTYGLSAAIFGADADVKRIAREIDAGGLYLNDIDLMGSVGMKAEKMAFKTSGMGGTRYGPGGFLRYVKQKAMILRHDAPATIDSLREDQN